mmetsp:Transcript_1965/g.5723  ORF Transcript_1965/g.5723 Transcript_1965/m.5723 type:complete len:213 (-) Transcript_1965:294-932(-)
MLPLGQQCSSVEPKVAHVPVCRELPQHRRELGVETLAGSGDAVLEDQGPFQAAVNKGTPRLAVRQRAAAGPKREVVRAPPARGPGGRPPRARGPQRLQLRLRRDEPVPHQPGPREVPAVDGLDALDVRGEPWVLCHYRLHRRPPVGPAVQVDVQAHPIVHPHLRLRASPEVPRRGAHGLGRQRIPHQRRARVRRHGRCGDERLRGVRGSGCR